MPSSQDTLDGRAGLALGLLADDLEHLLQAFHLALGFLQMVVEGLPQLGRIALLRHFGQRLQHLLLGVIDVLEMVKEQIVQGFHIGHGLALLGIRG